MATSSANNIAILKFNVPAESLSGIIGTFSLNTKAWSGGGRGSVVASTWQHSLKSRLANTQLKVGVQRGGTLPSGHYLCHYVANHVKFHECIRLEACTDAISINTPFSARPIALHRDKMYIHGRGDEGSDGCIVFGPPTLRHSLNKAVKEFSGKVYVQVVGTAYMLPAERAGNISA